MTMQSNSGKSRYWLIFMENKLVPASPNQLLHEELPSVFSNTVTSQKAAQLVGTHNERSVFVLDISAGFETFTEDNLLGLRQALTMVETSLFCLLARAWQITVFLRTHRFCGQCGSEMQLVDWELATHCADCNHRCYPRISPCIIVAIRKQNKILLAKGAHHKNDMMSVLAGFVESGETLEQAVHREVMEEVGIKINNLRYFDSQPWPFPHSLMVGFLADYDSGEIQVDGKEILSANWYSFSELPVIPPKLSIAGRLIQATEEIILSEDIR